MIKVVFKLKDDRYYSLDVQGHSRFEDPGKDLICAAVSSIMFGLMNAIDELNENVEIEQLTDRITITNYSKSEIVENYFELVIIQLKTIEESYGDFIKVERK